MDHPPPTRFQKRGSRSEGDFGLRPERTQDPPGPGLAATAARNVWLTFDDGPDPESTPQVLAALSGADIKATFFMLGRNVEAHPRLAERVFEAGHRIGNHSYSHPHLTDLAEAEIREEIVRADRLLAPYLGAEKLFRPPYGHTNALVAQIAADLGYRQVRWTVDPRDWDSDYKPRKWMDFAIARMHALSSCVVLLHDVQPGTGANLAAFIARIRQWPGTKFQAPSTL